MNHSSSFWHSLVTRYILVFLLGILLVTLPPLFFLYNTVREHLSKATKEEATLLCQCSVSQFEQDFLGWEAISRGLVARITTTDTRLTAAELRKSLENTLSASDTVLAVLVAFEAGVLPEHHGAPQMMMLRNQPGAAVQYVTKQDFLTEEWYRIIKETQKAQWLEPFTGKDIGELVATYASPLYRTTADGQRHFIGVACIDISCAMLQKEVNQIRPAGGHAFLLSRNQRVLACRDAKYLGKKLEELVDYRTSMDFDLFSQKLTEGCPLDTPIENITNGETLHLFCNLMRYTGWSFALIFPETRLTLLFHAFQHTFFLMLCEIIGLLILLALGIYLFMSTPLRKARQYAMTIGKGKLDAPPPETIGGGEIAELVETINTMRLSLQDHIAHLQDLARQQERTANEIYVAKRIQLGILPDKSSAAFDNPSFRISAEMIPAREVGGDLFDVAMLSPTKLCVVIGDVSGKGIPAAMVMVVTQTLARGILQSGALSPAQVVARLNDHLCAYRHLKFFVTYFLGIIDTESGVLTYCNAGHTPFIVLKKNGAIENPCQRNGIPIGVKAKYPYTESRCIIEPGDSLMLYTDGVTDAENNRHRFFGKGRLQAMAAECARQHASPEELLQGILGAVADFAGTCEQHDDITLLCVKRHDTAIPNH